MYDFLKRVPHVAIVREALAFTWRHKQLWALGIVAMLIDLGGTFEIVLKALPLGDRAGVILSWNGWLNQLVPFADLWRSTFLAASYGTPEGLIAAFVTAAVVLIATGLVVFLMTIAVGSLVHAIGNAEDGCMPTFAGSARAALKKFWPTLAVVATVHLVLSLAVGNAATALEWVVSTGSVVSAIAFSVALAVFILVAIVVSIMAIFALNEILMNDRGAVEAGMWSWFYLRRHAVAAVELAILILFVGAVVFMAALSVLLVCGVPLLLLTAVFAWLKVSAATAIINLFTTVLIYALAIAAAGFVGVFQVAVWHLFWQCLAHRTFMDKVRGLFRRLLGKRG